MKKNHFYISVSNGLLQDNHQKRMGKTVWQFLWCLDKVTKIDNEGRGVVLGGKPIKLKDISGTHRVTVSRNLTHLEKEGYITLLHTPRGIIIKVMKMKKSFNKIVKPRFSENAKAGLAKTLKHRNTNAKPVYTNAKPNKTTAVDNSSRDNLNRTEEVVAVAPTPKEVAKLFFDGVLDLIEKRDSPLIKDFLAKIAEKNTAIPKGKIWDEIRNFCSYWTEKNGTGTRELWQLQKTFEVDRRLATWFRRAGMKQFSGPERKGKSIIGLD